MFILLAAALVYVGYMINQSLRETEEFDEKFYRETNDLFNWYDNNRDELKSFGPEWNFYVGSKRNTLMEYDHLYNTLREHFGAVDNSTMVVVDDEIVELVECEKSIEFKKLCDKVWENNEDELDPSLEELIEAFHRQ